MLPSVRWILLAILLVGCDSTTMPSAPTDRHFIALGHDFEGFLDWPSIALDSDGQFAGHAAGSTQIHLRGIVPGVGIPFEKGTILVKATPGPTYPEWEVHAMVKRGEGFNPQGALGWEWFNLVLDEQGVPAISWRGVGTEFDPGTYAFQRDGSTQMAESYCSVCHQALIDDDYVFSRRFLGQLD